MMKHAIPFTLFACLVTATMTLAASETRTDDKQQTVVSIQGDRILINGVRCNGTES